MSEPRLEDIDDYDTLKGKKKKVVWIVIIVGLVLGAIYSIAYNMYDYEDKVETNDIVKELPVNQNIITR
ncbi:MAG: hypothetical protein GW906_04915 [Epsilonproteobacteria bacterium]|nr:hypothetical protein [Campylobacterota bacterium]OIO14805.1 MAG: hypothetical protein AUJ81_08405 [Helicobacteraceae bacterium CG1_02_36_14]PIP10895.1 MAG: hypothetical protein COX50_03480 [Sulfurimonas sp. CG23_combo_of_CG06-09_8_20_14_all_36_33]PIS26754.1 MAG: hypothetical protein COT46_01450 [Sulfurimonas sp. CG08_land_8_20_14_0_20_36_33]PIU35072.1 MAG: hypothetical protein COT05_04995 [Sulfurimonas sp. CG07_land_8_20_14_0_80_36_56]PIV03317.1 MAG: hypothetical protein COS56_08940 [Sulfur